MTTQTQPLEILQYLHVWPPGPGTMLLVGLDDWEELRARVQYIPDQSDRWFTASIAFATSGVAFAVPLFAGSDSLWSTLQVAQVAAIAVCSLGAVLSAIAMCTSKRGKMSAKQACVDHMDKVSTKAVQPVD